MQTDMFQCMYCSKTFSSVSNLGHHQKTAKYCLDKQGIDTSVASNALRCEFCDKQYTTVYRLRDHQTSCSKKRETEEKTATIDRFQYQHTVEMYEMRIQLIQEKYEREIALLREQLDLQKEQLEMQKEQLDKRMEDITDIARQTKTKTTNNIVVNSTSYLNLGDTAYIKNVLEQHLDGNVLADGQRGLARMITEQLLTDENGQKKYKCTDRSRDQFEYVDPNGVLERDPKGIKLREALIESNLKDVAMTNGAGLWKQPDGSIDHERFNVLSNKVLEVANLHSDDTKFRRELSVLLS